MKDDRSWDKEGKYIVLIVFITLILTLFGMVKSCVDSDNNSPDPTMRPIGHGY
ncbi:hypothetical protein [Mesonia mobilis]|uniref:Uncharacterized protein n=1 Tax=Mesonia mobilis TaxID=369791 RepID=A0ABQ3C219_9FLAO|nr:hypothetical protein [Mesonia mobilis]MBQ0739567.1 hypothetical protein [Aquimarina celericrescens]GGZ64844.1 hypothetical protein GCM10008088_27890 [Mesonia mobilis]